MLDSIDPIWVSPPHDIGLRAALYFHEDDMDGIVSMIGHDIYVNKKENAWMSSILSLVG